MSHFFRSYILTYKTAPVAIREQAALPEQGVREFLQYMRKYTQATDVLVVSTCNRTEIYFNAEQTYASEIFTGLKLVKQTNTDLSPYFTLLEDKEAIEHLFNVSIGLDAQVVGDLQISGQVKNAYQWSADENMAGPFLHRLMHTIFYVNKRVVQETAFRDGAASISYAAKVLAEDLTAGIRQPKILVVGVGEIGQDVCLNLKETTRFQVKVVNRTIEKAQRLAEKCGFEFGGLNELAQEINKADLVISSVSGENTLITKQLVERETILSHKYFIDLSMPRSVDVEIESIPGVLVYNLDDIREKTNETVEKRKAAIPQVVSIIADAITDFDDWSKEMVVSPTIQKLKHTLEQIRKEELARYLKNAKPEEAEKLEEMSRSLVQKILKYPVLQLKAACKRGDAESLSEILNDLFNLEKVKERN
ncbi:MAG: glutamyl-tRNA reductase [Flammeovirgaceae bacterium]|jgi:glutamyl-tRNA reductase|nr:glutamyl-tRNA reductase [Flammeovirgaceae bacterium]